MALSQTIKTPFQSHVTSTLASYNRSRRFHCGDGSPTRRSSKASKTSTLIRLSRSLGTSRKVCYRKTNIRVLENV
ncbi:hypothetical protein PIB30_065849 [Stylosanthes scabra]|uniref:Uncharacterized protein n=1 Tax=Stylosanthes scabra TaxID=79078 RepID=A0ABU6VKG1_9FABA|nr:hypothetical protein [Stylosanthes scabra]